MVGYDEAVHFLREANNLLHDVYADEAKQANAERSAEMDFTTKNIPFRVSHADEVKQASAKMGDEMSVWNLIIKTSQMREEIDEALHELRDAVKGMRKILAQELRDTTRAN